MDLNPIVFDLQAKLCQVLGHSVRLKIIHALKEGALSVNTIASMVKVTQQTIPSFSHSPLCRCFRYTSQRAGGLLRDNK